MALLERPVEYPSQSAPTETIRTVELDGYGPSERLSVRRAAKPVIGDDDLLVRVAAAALNPLDWQLTTGQPYVGRLQHGLRRPKITGIGIDLAGTVEAVGRNVTQFAPDDEVFGCVESDPSGHPGSGSCAEYALVTADHVARMPKKVSFRTAAAACTSGLIALQGLRDQGRLRAGHRVLVNGACGGVGTFAVQIAKAFGCDVSAVCRAPNIELVRSLGADDVIDDNHDDFTFGGRHYDVILDNLGNRSLAECRNIMHRDSVYVAAFRRPDHRWTGPTAQLLKMYAVRPFVSQEMLTWIAKPNTVDLEYLAELLESRKMKSVIDRTYPLCDIGLAMRHLESGSARGKIVITL